MRIACAGVARGSRLRGGTTDSSSRGRRGARRGSAFSGAPEGSPRARVHSTGAARGRRREERHLRRRGLEAGEPHLQGADAVGGVEQGGGERAGGGGDGLLVGERRAPGIAAPRGVARAAHLDGERACRQAEGLQAPGGPAGEGVDHLLERLAVAAAVADRRLLLEGGGGRGDGDGGFLLSPRRGTDAGRGRRAEGGGEHGLLRLGHLAEGGEARALERALEVEGEAESRHGLSRHEGELVAGEHDQEAAGLRPARGDAGGQPRGREAERGVEAEAPLQLVADRLRRAHRGRVARALRGQVHERLVGRGPLDAAAGREEDRGHLFAVAAVGVEVSAAEGGLGAQAAGLGHREADPHSRPARLLADRGHEAHAVAVAADDDGALAQRRVEAALDRDEERVEIDVQDVVAPLPHDPSVGGRGAGRGPVPRGRRRPSCWGPWSGRRSPGRAGSCPGGRRSGRAPSGSGRPAAPGPGP